ncbi:MAG: DUF192 domain-containing protein [Pseudomonadota bacterium]
MGHKLAAALLASACVLATAGCSGNGAASAAQADGRTVVTVQSANGPHVFKVEVAKTAAEQEKGLMYRTDIAQDGGMIFTPYPAEGGPPRIASFWMKNTPTALDIIFIRPDGTIATIAENTVPFSETPVGSTEPVSAVLEILGGRSAELGIAEGDKVSWAK